MGLTDENGIGTTMLVSPSNGAYPYPVYSQGGGNNNGFGDNGWWVILLIIILAVGGFNNNGNGGGLGGQPIIVNDGNGGSVQRDFDQSAIMGGITGITTGLCNGFADVQQSLCNGFAGVNQTVSNGFSQAEIAENARQMANMQQMFSLSQQFADCCCKNQLATCQTQNIIQNEGNQTRFADANNTRDIIDNANRNNQAVLDKLCQLELDAKNDKISQLERELTMANLSASQTAQTARILADNASQTQAIEQYLNPVPIPAYMVQNPNCCSQNTCGCGF